MKRHLVNRFREAFDLVNQDDIEDQTRIEYEERRGVKPFEYGIERFHRYEDAIEKKEKRDNAKTG